MSLPNRSSGAHFLNLSAYNKFRSFISRRSDSSVSDVESIQSSRADEQGCAESLSWDTRVEVAIGAAKGLALLHDAKSPVIHRDVKSSNILLDSDFNAKLSEFGLARVGPTGDMTHVSTRVMGTMGYAAPEYLATDADTINASFQLIWAFVSTGIFSSTLLMLVVIIIIQHFPIKIETGHLSAKADVYSFGVVLLELLSGRRAYDESNSGTERNLVDWARPYLGNRRKLVIVRLMDSKLEGRFPKMAVQAMAKLVSVCIANDPKLRPRMSEVLALLEKLQGP